MIDETTASQSTSEGSAGPSEGSAEGVVAFCQQCGRALTASTRRQVGTGVFCEPCATVRETQGAAWTAVNPGGSPYTAAPPAAGEPNPALAGFLGLIPGVGAMYNGQYAKGVIHLIVFVVLVSLADNLNWVFWWFVWGWIFYQAFESYHTAQARRDGLPVPDAFGWNELGERLGFSRPPVAGTPRPPRSSGFQTPPPPVTPAPPVQTAAVPAGYAYDAPGATFTPPPPSAGTSVYGQVPYASTFVGEPAAPGVYPVPAAPSRQRFPVGAVWLIGLGFLFLLGNILPSWRISGRWLVPVVLAGIALWIGSRKLISFEETAALTPAGGIRPSLAGALLGPCILLTVAVLLAMQDAHWIPLKHSWPALLIIWGALLLLQRAQSPPSTWTPGPLDPAGPISTPAPPAPDTSSR